MYPDLGLRSAAFRHELLGFAERHARAGVSVPDFVWVREDRCGGCGETAPVADTERHKQGLCTECYAELVFGIVVPHDAPDRAGGSGYWDPADDPVLHDGVRALER